MKLEAKYITPELKDVAHRLAEMFMLMEDISPVLDDLILATPTGELRNKLTDLNIRAKYVISRMNDKLNDQ